VNRVGRQEVSTPVMVSIIAAAVILIGLLGWYFFLRPQPYPGFQAPPGMAGQGAPGTMPGPAPSGSPAGGPR